MSRRPIRAILRNRSGVTSLEWALVAGVFMLMIISIFDLVRYVVVAQSVTTVMEEAGRACMVNTANCPNSGDGNATWSTLSTVVPMLDPSQFTVTSAHSIPGVNEIQITVSYPFTAMTPWMSVLNATITESATYYY